MNYLQTHCEKCSFELFDGVAALAASDLGLVNDARYAGRCILGLRAHAEHCDDLSAAAFAGFCRDAQRAAAAIRKVTECDRVNVFLLGNRTSHLHFHLVPRILDGEAGSFATPFEDPRPPTPLAPDIHEQIANALREELAQPSAKAVG